MEEPEFTAELAVNLLEEGDDEHHGMCLRELENMLENNQTRVRQHLVAAGLPRVLLLRSAQAAAAGDLQASGRYRRHAVLHVGEQEVQELLEEHRIHIRSTPQESPPTSLRAGFGFAS